MKSLIQYITEKQGYINYEDFAEEITLAIQKDLDSRLNCVGEDVINYTFQHLSNEDIESSNQSMFKAVCIMDTYAEALDHCLKERGIWNITKIFNSTDYHNPFWLDRLIVKVTDQLPKEAFAAVNKEDCVFDDHRREAALHIRPVDSVDVIVHDYCLPRFNVFIRTHNRNITRENLKEFIYKLTNELFIETGLLDKERIKKNIIHEISHTFDLYLAQIKDVKYLKNALGEDYIHFQSQNNILSCFAAAGYMMNKSEINARKQEIIYWTRKNMDKKEGFNKIYIFLKELHGVKNISDFQVIAKKATDICDKIPPLDNLLYILLRVIQCKYIIEQEKDISELILAVNKSQVFKKVVGFNKELKDKNDLLKQTDKLVNTYFERLDDILKSAVKHLVQ